MRWKSGFAALSTSVAAVLALSGASAQQKIQKVGYIADLSGPMQDNYGSDPRGF